MDTEAADVVRHLSNGGRRRKNMADCGGAERRRRKLSKNYKVEAGCTRTPWRSIQEENFWTANLVAKFLRDERYIGKTVYGKTEPGTL